MGYYKKLSTGDFSGARPKKTNIGTGGPIDITIHYDLEKLFRDFEQLGQYKRRQKPGLRKIHKKVGGSGARAMRKVIVDYPREINVRRTGKYGGKAGSPIDVASGTLRNSIGVIDPGNGTNMWLGPRSSAVGGARAGSKLDGWFAHIVDAGEQYFGPGQNKNFFNRGLAKGEKNMTAMLRREHAKLLNKVTT